MSAAFTGVSAAFIREQAARARGLVFDIQRYSLHDGPGLRTNVFFKGCPLACEWCSNPESQGRRPQVAFFERSCFLCGDCLAACPRGAIALAQDRLHWEPNQCDSCAQCVPACASGAFRLIGEHRTAGEILAEALRDAPFYGEGGGITLTGGEPALQPEFAAALLELAKSEGLHTAIETCGAVPWSHYLPCLPNLDLVLYDLKQIDPAAHRRGTRAANRRILDNARRMAQAGVNLVVRVPLVPGFNTHAESLCAIAAFVASLQTVREVHLLPYHTLARAKYAALGRPYPLADLPPMRPEEAAPLADLFRGYGFKVLVGG